MKHKLKITLVLIAMFIIAQIVGLLVIYSYSPETKLVFNETLGVYQNITVTPELPYGMQPPEIRPGFSLTTLIVSFAIAIILIFVLMRLKATIFLRFWFFFVVTIALGLAFNSLLFHFTDCSSYLAIIIALPLAFIKVFKRNIIIHNLTELLIYPGIAAVFVPILRVWSVILVLILISAYDVYAVWHSGFMQKMAKFQMNKVKIFAGFFVPYMNKKDKEKVQMMKEKYKESKLNEKLKKARIRVNLAILGGGDVVFPIIFTGVVFRSIGLPALVIPVFSSIALLLLLVFSQKGKFYPAMPFITAGCFAGLLASYFVSLI